MTSQGIKNMLSNIVTGQSTFTYPSSMGRYGIACGLRVKKCNAEISRSVAIGWIDWLCNH